MNSDCINRYVPVYSENGVCGFCEVVMTEAHDLSDVHFGRFESSSPVEKKAMLRKRSRDHSNSKLERERRVYLERKQMGL